VDGVATRSFGGDAAGDMERTDVTVVSTVTTSSPEVTIRPSPSSLPGFAAGLEPRFAARRSASTATGASVGPSPKYGRAGMRVLVWSSESSRARARGDAYEVAAERDALFADSDVLSLHLRLVDVTRGIPEVNSTIRSAAVGERCSMK
jgi:hypothetical protein